MHNPHNLSEFEIARLRHVCTGKANPGDGNRAQARLIELGFEIARGRRPTAAGRAYLKALDSERVTISRRAANCLIDFISSHGCVDPIIDELTELREALEP